MGQHYTDWLSEEATKFIEDQKDSSKPFYMHIAANDPHLPLRVPERYQDSFLNTPLPKPPSFDEANVSDKPAWVQKQPRVSASDKQEYTLEYRKRLRTALTLKDLCRRVIDALARAGELDNTYIIFTSDNGYHMGLHRLAIRKFTPYMEAHEVPFVVRGPHVPRGSSNRLVANIDIAPTVLDLANIRAPRWMDGRSLVPLLDGSPPGWWRTGLLIEGVQTAASPSKGGRPSYDGVRWRNQVYVRYGTGEEEYYNLARDPYELRNNPQAAPQAMKNQLQRLKTCKGASCRHADRL